MEPLAGPPVPRDLDEVDDAWVALEERLQERLKCVPIRGAETTHQCDCKGTPRANKRRRRIGDVLEDLIY